MASRWFRISFARNAFLRTLESDGRSLESITVAQGVHAMAGFFRDFRPQHSELDELVCSWGPNADLWEFSVARRMRRHGHPESVLELAFGFANSENRTSSGTAAVTTEREVRELDGYASTRGARPKYRRLDQL